MFPYVFDFYLLTNPWNTIVMCILSYLSFYSRPPTYPQFITAMLLTEVGVRRLCPLLWNRWAGQLPLLWREGKKTKQTKEKHNNFLKSRAIWKIWILVKNNTSVSENLEMPLNCHRLVKDSWRPGDILEALQESLRADVSGCWLWCKFLK